MVNPLECLSATVPATSETTLAASTSHATGSDFMEIPITCTPTTCTEWGEQLKERYLKQKLP